MGAPRLAWAVSLGRAGWEPARAAPCRVCTPGCRWCRGLLVSRCPSSWLSVLADGTLTPDPGYSARCQQPAVGMAVWGWVVPLTGLALV